MSAVLKIIGKMGKTIEYLLIIGAQTVFLVSVYLMDYYICHIYTNEFIRYFITGIYNVVMALCIITYFRAVFINPGLPHEQDMTKIAQAETCTTCHKWKPERTHHCSNCHRCVLMMDHHCPWIANCVGYYNYKYFIVFSFYATITSFYYDCTVAYIYLFRSGSPYEIFPGKVTWFNLAFLVIGNFLSISMSTLWLAHMSSFFSTVTSVEETKGASLQFFLCAGCNPIINNVHPYELGVIHNIERMFKSWVFLWWLPFTCYNKSGFEFDKKPVATQIDMEMQTSLKKEISDEEYFNSISKKYPDEKYFISDLIMINNLSHQ